MAARNGKGCCQQNTVHGDSSSAIQQLLAFWWGVKSLRSLYSSTLHQLSSLLLRGKHHPPKYLARNCHRECRRESLGVNTYFFPYSLIENFWKRCTWSFIMPVVTATIYACFNKKGLFWNSAGRIQLMKLKSVGISWDLTSHHFLNC